MPTSSPLVLSSFEPSTPPLPSADSFGDALVRRFEPWLTDDLESYLRAVALMFDQVVLLTYASDDDEAWTILFDPERCPVEDLPYLAQFVGERLPTGLAEADQRLWIEDAANRRRGTPESVFLAAQRRLTGSRLVSMLERAGGVVDKLQIVTYASQTPDQAGTLADILSVLPADVVLEYQVQTGLNWTQVAATYATWDLAKVKTWNELVSGLVGWTTFPRPT